jgi:hypothetical protein
MVSVWCKSYIMANYFEYVAYMDAYVYIAYMETTRPKKGAPT